MDYKKPIAATKAALLLVYLLATIVVWWGNAELPLEFHDREMFADHERIATEPAFFFSADKAQYNGRWLANAYQLAVYWFVGENSPFVYRLMALLLHGVVTALLVRLALLKGCSALVAHGAGLWFLVTPSHYQVIHHISAVDYILYALFGLWALSRIVARRAWDGWVILGLLCAMLSHQSGVVFAVFCWHALYQGRWRAGFWSAVLVGGAGMALWFSLPATTSGGGATTAFSTLLSWQYTWELVRSFIGLLGRLLAFSFFFPLPPNSASSGLVLLGCVALVSVVFLGYRRHPAFPWTIGAMALCLPFALLINEFLAGLTAGPIRYLYFSSGFAFVAILMLLESLVKRWLSLCIGAGVVVALFSWAEARELTRASAAWAAADGHEEEALALYLSLWQSELLPSEYIEGAHENALILAVGRADNFDSLFAQARTRYPDNERIGLVAASIEILEEPRALARYAAVWAADAEASMVVGSILYRLFRYHARGGETDKMYAALVLAQALSPREHMAKALAEVRRVLASHDKLDIVHAEYIRAYGL